ncbi:dentin sialophosphoprotein-like [Periplaneta americana]|uniref:dentin sialophosphoprotein-like n=1 Tax=Periplaneta americana TaxID=6978 RepID=UPI0037E7904B
MSVITQLGLLLLFTVVASTHPTPELKSSGCAGGVAFYADSADCNAYYQCVQGKGVLMHCAAGLHWHAEANTCDWPNNANCVLDRGGSGDGSESGDSSKSSGDASTSEESVAGSDSSSSESSECPEDSNPPKCPSKDPALSVFFPHPDKHYFYHCSNGVAYCKVCPSNLEWNTQCDTCDWPGQNNCPKSSESGDSSKSSGDASTSEESVPGSDSSSSESEQAPPPPPPEKDSGSGDSSKSSGDASTSEESVPGSDSSSSESNECPEDSNPPKCPSKDPALSVFFPHPDKHYFYHCSNGVAYCKVCPSNLEWNTNCDTCDWPGQNNCPKSSESGDSSKSSGDASTSEESVPGSDSSSSESEPAPPPPPPEKSSESGDSSKSSGDDGTSEESVPGSDSSSSESNECPKDSNPPKCPSKDPALSVFFPHPDKHYFYHCSNGVAYCKVCPSNLEWNTNCDTCDWPGQNNCPKSSESGDSSKSSGDASTSEESVPGSDSSSSESNECPKDSNPPKCPSKDPALSVFFPHPDKHYFYHCSNGVAYCKVCPSNLEWNTNCDTCDWPGQNNCLKSSESGDSSKSSGDASTSEESVPGSDSSSSESEPAPPPPPPEKSSESGDSSKSSGDDGTSEESVPGSDSSSSESNECPEDNNPPKCPSKDPALSVFFPHPDKHYFYHCSNGVAYCKACPSNLVWNTQCDTCDRPGQNNCPKNSESGDSSKSSGDASTSEESVPGSDSSSEE